MTMEHNRALDEARIRTAIGERANALRAKGVGGFVSRHAATFATFDRSPRLRCSGAAALGEGREGWLSAFRGSVGCEIHDLSITAGDDEALCDGLVRITGSRTGGDQIDVWAPATFCLRKVDGAWKVTNEHTPLPFYMDGSAKPAGDLADYPAQA
jgi:ketosteroid isomerase-like protein